MRLSPNATPRLLTHYHICLRPGDTFGEEELSFRSSRRKIRIRGRGLGIIYERFLPLLDGTRTVSELISSSAIGFSPEELEQCLDLLASNRLIVLESDGDVAPYAAGRVAPQLNFFHEVDLAPWAGQRRLHDAVVAVLGLGGVGAYAALAIAAAQVGRVHCVDDVPLTGTDFYFAPILARADIGLNRAIAMRRLLEGVSIDVTVSTSNSDLSTDEGVDKAIAGCDFVICSVDNGRSRLLYQVNRACLRQEIPWTSSSLEGIEAVLGPTVLPGRTACYLCYKMRVIACASEPAAALTFEAIPESRNYDPNSIPENLTFAAGVMGNLAALEAFKAITGAGEYSAAGAILVMDVFNGGWEKHSVLRKPWCPSCFPDDTR